MKNFVIEKYSNTHTYLRNHINYEDLNWFEDLNGFPDYPYIPSEKIKSESAYFERDNIKKKVLIPCPEGWNKIEWRIAYEAIDRLHATHPFKVKWADRGNLEIRIFVNQIDEDTWEAFCEAYPENPVIIYKNELPNFEEESTKSQLELKIEGHKNKTIDFLFDQRKALVEYQRNKESKEALNKLQCIKEDLETIIKITGFSKEIENIYIQIDNILYEQGM